MVIVDDSFKIVVFGVTLSTLLEFKVFTTKLGLGPTRHLVWSTLAGSPIVFSTLIGFHVADFVSFGKTVVSTIGFFRASRRRSDSAIRSCNAMFKRPSDRDPRRFNEQWVVVNSSRPEQPDKSSSSSSSWTILHFLAR